MARKAGTLGHRGKQTSYGWAYFLRQRRFVINSSWLNKELHHILSKLQETRVDHVPRGLVVTEVFNVYRLFCRGATTRAREANVPNDVTETNNRWSKIERKSSGMPRMSMAELYTEIRQADATKICFSKSL